MLGGCDHTLVAGGVLPTVGLAEAGGGHGESGVDLEGAVQRRDRRVPIGAAHRLHAHEVGANRAQRCRGEGAALVAQVLRRAQLAQQGQRHPLGQRQHAVRRPGDGVRRHLFAGLGVVDASVDAHLAAQFDRLAVDRPVGTQVGREPDCGLGGRVVLSEAAAPAAHDRPRVHRPQVANPIQVGRDHVHQTLTPDDQIATRRPVGEDRHRRHRGVEGRSLGSGLALHHPPGSASQ